jgi:hypothetical protein
METSRNRKEAYTATREQVAAQLMMIETVHGIRIVNRDTLSETIARAAGDRTLASRATAALNTWVAVNRIQGETVIPDDVVAKILRQMTR